MSDANYFVGNQKSPYHLSVGAVVLNDKNEVACHYFDTFEDFSDFYILMRETVELGESIEQAITRGLIEEFGMKARLVDYLGSLVLEGLLWKGIPFTQQKTTLYFLCEYTEHDTALRRADDPEGSSEIRWKDIDFLIERMKEQGERLKHSTLDESKILLRVKEYISFKEER